MNAKTITRVMYDATKDLDCLKRFADLPLQAQAALSPEDITDDPRELAILNQVNRISYKAMRCTATTGGTHQAPSKRDAPRRRAPRGRMEEQMTEDNFTTIRIETGDSKYWQDRRQRAMEALADRIGIGKLSVWFDAPPDYVRGGCAMTLALAYEKKLEETQYFENGEQ